MAVREAANDVREASTNRGDWRELIGFARRPGDETWDLQREFHDFRWELDHEIMEKLGVQARGRETNSK